MAGSPSWTTGLKEALNHHRKGLASLWGLSKAENPVASYLCVVSGAVPRRRSPATGPWRLVLEGVLVSVAVVANVHKFSDSKYHAFIIPTPAAVKP